LTTAPSPFPMAAGSYTAGRYTLACALMTVCLFLKEIYGDLKTGRRYSCKRCVS
jgi:hypothetical protein